MLLAQKAWAEVREMKIAGIHMTAKTWLGKCHGHFSRMPQNCHHPPKFWTLQVGSPLQKGNMQKRNMHKMPNPFFRVLAAYLVTFMLVPNAMWAQFLINPPTFPDTCCRFFSERTFGEIGVAWIFVG